MVFRGTIENGKVILDGEVSLPNGTRVDVQPARARAKPATKKRVRAKAKRTGASAKPDPFLSLMGLFKDRPDWKGKSGSQIVTEQRARRRSNRLGNGRR